MDAKEPIVSASSEAASPVAPGVVYLVGAGPGGVGLLTVRAVEVLVSCDAVLHDRLVPSEITRLARPDAEVRYVGKDGDVATGKMKAQQDDISSQLVELARRGLSVCRLKGGDPMIYGRAGEEMEMLAAAGVAYEVVPAVTAALAASADACVPLTFRGVSTALRIHTLNPTTTTDPSFDWTQFGAPMTTYALYMGLKALPGVCEKLQTAGIPGLTPMAVVDRASMAESQTVAGTVATLPAVVRERPDLVGPAIVILGDVVALRSRLEGPKPPAIPPPRALLAAQLASLPALDDDALLALKCQADALLASRAAVASSDGVSMTPAKRPAED